MELLNCRCGKKPKTFKRHVEYGAVIYSAKCPKQIECRGTRRVDKFGASEMATAWNDSLSAIAKKFVLRRGMWPTDFYKEGQRDEQSR